MNPPKQIYFDEKSSEQSVKPFRISQRNANTIQYALILGVLITTLYAFMNFKQGNIMSFFGTQAFIHVALSYVFIYIFWQGITNKLSKFPVEIVKSNVKRNRPRQTRLHPMRNMRKTALFSIIGYTLSLAFTIMVMIFLAVAVFSGTGETRVIWNHFGEMAFETVLFICAFIVIIIGYVFTFRWFKQETKKVI